MVRERLVTPLLEAPLLPNFYSYLAISVSCRRIASTLLRNNTPKQWFLPTGVPLAIPGIVRSQGFLGGVGFEFLTTLGVGVGCFCPTPTPDVQLDYFLNHTFKLGIPVEMVVSFETFVETEISCCAPRFHWFYQLNFIPFMLRSRESEILERPESGVGNFGKVGVGYFTSDSAILAPR